MPPLHRRPETRSVDGSMLAVPSMDLPQSGSRIAWRSLALVAALLALGHWAITVRLAGSNLLNSYPFTASDSYDWLLEGYALARWSEGVPQVTLPVLRNPLFVLVTFSDFLLGGDGVVVLTVISGSFFLLLYALIAAARRLSAPLLESGIVLWSVIVSPLAFFRPYILSDLMATSLMIAAVVLLIPYWRHGWRRWLLAAILVGVAAGLTQIYGMIPLLVVGGWMFLTSLIRRRPDWILGSALTGALLVTISLHRLWHSVVPHDVLPTNWGLLEFSTGMTSFYLNAWAFAFGAMLPAILLVIGRRWKGIWSDPLRTGSWLAVCVLLLGNFFYQWEDFRLTLPASGALALALVISIGDRKTFRSSILTKSTFLVSAALLTIVSLTVAPSSYWVPSIDEMEFAPHRTWAGRLVNAEPLDRFGVNEHCGEDQVICKSVPLPEGLTPYRRNVLTTFIVLAPE
jgi:hypothetical protein